MIIIVTLFFVDMMLFFDCITGLMIVMRDRPSRRFHVKVPVITTRISSLDLFIAQDKPDHFGARGVRIH